MGNRPSCRLDPMSVATEAIAKHFPGGMHGVATGSNTDTADVGIGPDGPADTDRNTVLHAHEHGATTANSRPRPRPGTAHCAQPCGTAKPGGRGASAAGGLGGRLAHPAGARAAVAAGKKAFAAADHRRQSARCQAGEVQRPGPALPRPRRYPERYAARLWPGRRQSLPHSRGAQWKDQPARGRADARRLRRHDLRSTSGPAAPWAWRR
ncbi:hypothetical protein PS627_02188 [Pseudomonas fluorescens]|nr:hypothetical protein PS627_02188 [Pseudomonas fluorescens]